MTKHERIQALRASKDQSRTEAVQCVDLLFSGRPYSAKGS